MYVRKGKKKLGFASVIFRNSYLYVNFNATQLYSDRGDFGKLL